MSSSSEMFEGLEKLAQEVKQRKLKLNSQLSKVDKEIADIQHYIEFYPFNACQGYKIAKMIKDCLIERRTIKNEMEALVHISRMNVGDIGAGKGKAVLARIKDKQYTPRVLTELFKNPPTERREVGAQFKND